MLKRLIGRRLFGSTYINLHIRTHKYLRVGFEINPHTVEAIAFKIYGLDIKLFLLFIDIDSNINTARDNRDMFGILGIDEEVDEDV